jgi:N-acetylated-alpha-linked acidic dipeptidase
MMRLADAPLLPFEFGRLAVAIRNYTEQIASLPNPPAVNPAKRPDFAALAGEITRLQKAAADLSAAYDRAQPNLASASREKLDALNRVLFRTERALTADPGLPGRPWYRHLVYAPGVYTGYAAKTLPGIREAMEAGRIDEAREEAIRVVHALNSLEEQIGQATTLLGQL